MNSELKRLFTATKNYLKAEDDYHTFPSAAGLAQIKQKRRKLDQILFVTEFREKLKNHQSNKDNYHV